MLPFYFRLRPIYKPGKSVEPAKNKEALKSKDLEKIVRLTFFD